MLAICNRAQTYACTHTYTCNVNNQTFHLNEYDHHQSDLENKDVRKWSETKYTCAYVSIHM